MGRYILTLKSAWVSPLLNQGYHISLTVGRGDSPACRVKSELLPPHGCLGMPTWALGCTPESPRGSRWHHRPAVAPMVNQPDHGAARQPSQAQMLPGWTSECFCTQPTRIPHWLGGEVEAEVLTGSISEQVWLSKQQPEFHSGYNHIMSAFRI